MAALRLARPGDRAALDRPARRQRDLRVRHGP
jgi:hypothetical protein